MTTDTINIALEKMFQTRDNAYNDLKEFIKNLPNKMVRTVPCMDKPTIYAMFEIDSTDYENRAIYAIAYVEEEDELFICTDESIANYEYDNNYSFESLYDLNDEDMAELEKLISVPDYFIPFYDDNMVVSQTLVSILAGLPVYL